MNIAIISIILLNLFMIFVIYKQLQIKENIIINVKQENFLKLIIIPFYIITFILILLGFENIYLKFLLILFLTLSILVNLISPFSVGISRDKIYYYLNRNYGTFPIRNIEIKNLGTVKLTIKKEKNYVRFEVLQTQIYQIYEIKDLDKIKKSLEGNIIKIDDRSNSN